MRSLRSVHSTTSFQTTSERARAATEVCRVLKSGGLAFVAVVPRLAGIAGLIERAARSPEQVTPETIRCAAETGVFRNASSVGFQEGYYPVPGEIEGLLVRAGLDVLATISLRSIAHRLEKELQSLAGTTRVEAERVLASMSTLPEVVATSGHALIIARRRSKSACHRERASEARAGGRPTRPLLLTWPSLRSGPRSRTPVVGQTFVRSPAS
jgi:hypothetical protein